MLEKNDQLVIGYFNIRGKAQVPRLLCEYCNIPYKNKFYSPKQFLEEKKKNGNFNLPFVKQANTTIYGPEQMCLYILNKYGKDQMLGRTEEDKIKVKMYSWSIDAFATVIGTNAIKKPSKSDLQKQWEKNLKLKLKKYEKACSQNSEWFLGYLTLIDFSIYELVRYMDWMFPQKMKVFQRLCNIKHKLGMLPEIKAYQNSRQCVKEISPQSILQQISQISGQQRKIK